jgi:hypothetical protein
VFDGPDRKYAYRVTRKTDDFHWYWRETTVQIVALVVLSAALLYRVAHTASWSAFDMGLAYLTMLQILPLAGFVRKGWFGVSSVRREVPAVQTSLSAEPGD